MIFKILFLKQIVVAHGTHKKSLWTRFRQSFPQIFVVINIAIKKNCLTWSSSDSSQTYTSHKSSNIFNKEINLHNNDRLSNIDKSHLTWPKLFQSTAPSDKLLFKWKIKSFLFTQSCFRCAWEKANRPSDLDGKRSSTTTDVHSPSLNISHFQQINEWKTLFLPLHKRRK